VMRSAARTSATARREVTVCGAVTARLYPDRLSLTASLPMNGRPRERRSRKCSS
jgi:hypothetical protein